MINTKILTITNWWNTFENAKTRKLERIDYFAAPTRCDSAGYLELVTQGEDGLLALGVFQALCQGMGGRRLAERRHGAFASAVGKPMTLGTIAVLVRVPLEMLERVLPILEEAGWVAMLEDLPAEQECTQGNSDEFDFGPPPICQSSPADPPSSRNKERKGEERKGEESGEHPHAPSANKKKSKRKSSGSRRINSRSIPEGKTDKDRLRTVWEFAKDEFPKLTEAREDTDFLRKSVREFTDHGETYQWKWPVWQPRLRSWVRQDLEKRKSK